MATLRLAALGGANECVRPYIGSESRRFKRFLRDSVVSDGC